MNSIYVRSREDDGRLVLFETMTKGRPLSPSFRVYLSHPHLLRLQSLGLQSLPQFQVLKANFYSDNLILKAPMCR